MKRNMFWAFALLACVAPASAAPIPVPMPSVIFRAPADRAPAGPLPHDPSALVLPSGRLVRPAGLAVQLPLDATNVVLTPGGRYAIAVSSEPRTSALSVIDTATMSVVSSVPAHGVPFAGGVAIVKDLRHPGNQHYLVLATQGGAQTVAVFTLAIDGRLTPDETPTITLGAPAHPPVISRHFVANIVATAQRAYVVDELDRSVWELDVPARAVCGQVSVGFSPRAIALRGHTLLVSNEGLGDAHLTPPDLAHASSLSVIALDKRGDVRPKNVSSIALDQPPSGFLVGGAHPAALAITPAGQAFVALAGVDRLATVSPAQQKAIGGSELRLFDRGPYGTQPVALVLDPFRERLYAALAGIDAVAVIDVHDPKHPHRLGLIPVGDHPSAVALSADGGLLYVSSLRGRGVTGLVEQIDLTTLDLAKMTAQTLANVRRVQKAEPSAPVSVVTRVGARLQTVIQIRMPAATFSEVFSSKKTRFGPAVMPNLHRLAQQYTLLSGLYAPSELPLEGLATVFGGQASAYTVRTALAGDGRRSQTGALTPDDATRFGLVFDALRVRMRGYEIVSDCRDAALPCMQRFTTHLDTVLASKKTPAFIAVGLPDPVADAGLDPLVVAQNDDAALGLLIAHLAKTPLWQSSFIVISPWRTDNANDVIDPHRIYGVVISPVTVTSHVDGHHRTLAGLLKTEEELLRLPPLSLGEFLSNDCSEIFTSRVR